MHSAKFTMLFARISFVLTCLTCSTIGFSQEKAAAIVNGEVLTEGQLDAAIEPQLEAIRTQMSALKESGLSRLIDNLLIEQAARDARLSVADYLAMKVEKVAVSESEVDDAYERSKHQLPPTLTPEAKYRIRRSMEDSRRAEAMRSLLADLRRNAQVRNLLVENFSSGLNLEETKGPSLGDPSASVTIVEFGDFECPFCRSASPLVRRAVEKWPGKVRVVFKHFPLPSHPHALDLARGSVCAEREGRFWEFHDRVFQLGDPALDSEALLALAVSIGFDASRFSRCLRAADVEQTIQKDISVGRAAGVNATPTFFINKRKLSNAAELDGAIQDALSTLNVVGKE